jgi:hypothetical protein
MTRETSLKQKTPILIREPASSFSRLPPLRTGTDDRGRENRAHVGASDLQASPLSEGNPICKGCGQGSGWEGEGATEPDAIPTSQGTTSQSKMGVRGQGGRDSVWVPIPSRLHGSREPQAEGDLYQTATRDASTEHCLRVRCSVSRTWRGRAVGPARTSPGAATLAYNRSAGTRVVEMRRRWETWKRGGEGWMPLSRRSPEIKVLAQNLRAETLFVGVDLGVSPSGSGR